jgi:hypothetical protein
MRLPVRNKSERPLTIFIEPWCDDYELLPGGEALVDLEDGLPHSIDVYDGQVTVWSEGSVPPAVETIPIEDQSIVEALALGRVWLHQLGARDAAAAMDDAVRKLEGDQGYLTAHIMVFGAFHAGLQAKEAEQRPKGPALPPWAGDAVLAASRAAGGTAAYLNRRARRRFSFPGWGRGPLDTDTVRSAFERAERVMVGTERLASA